MIFLKSILKQKLDSRCAINALTGDVGLLVINGRNVFSIDPHYLLSIDSVFQAANGRGVLVLSAVVSISPRSDDAFFWKKEWCCPTKTQFSWNCMFSNLNSGCVNKKVLGTAESPQKFHPEEAIHFPFSWNQFASSELEVMAGEKKRTPSAQGYRTVGYVLGCYLWSGRKRKRLGRQRGREYLTLLRTKQN